MIEPTILDRLVEAGASEGDLASMAALTAIPTIDSQTPAALQRTALRAALEMLERNGLISIVDPAQWPERTETRSYEQIRQAYGRRERME